jgi:pimeloyl-ACP methyl ester carboxylesterase
MLMKLQPFTINVPQAALDDLNNRLARTRWIKEVAGADWNAGTNVGYMKNLVDYWQNQFDWRTQEAKLNRFAQFRAEIDGLGVHFIHERGKGPNPMPIILTHGWPDSFFRMVKIIPLLTDPARFGGDPADSFDVIVPSLPGYGFSDVPPAGGMALAHAAELWSKLMTGLGYQKFAAAGGDFGSAVTRFLALAHPDQVTGIHLTDIGYPGGAAFTKDMENPSEAEQAYLGAVQGWFYQEGAYAMIQATKPHTLAAGLNDSPVGLATWIIEKFRTWSDCDGDVEKSFTKDELLTNIMIYWVTQTIGSSIRTYNESESSTIEAGQHIEVPAAYLRFPKDLGPTIPPREMAERYLRIQRWTEMPRGGHFAAMEEPELLVEDMRAFFPTLR